jgi:hypothetical protein
LDLGMSRMDGDPRVFAPELFARLTRREQIVVSRLTELREDGRFYGLPDPAVRADLVRYPSREEAAHAAGDLVSKGVRKANLAWVLPAWVGAGSVVFIGATVGTWPVILSATVVVVVALDITVRYVRRIREVRRWSDAEFARLAILDEADLPAVKDPADPGAPRPRTLITRGAPRFPRWAVVAGALVGVVVLGLASSSVWEVRGWPRERATLLSAPDHQPPSGTWCGKGGGEPRDFTWQSSNPPAGLPARFVQLDECNVSVNPGDTTTVVRVIDSSGHVHVHVDPVLSYGEAVALTGFVSFIWFATAAAVVGIARLGMTRLGIARRRI